MLKGLKLTEVFDSSIQDEENNEEKPEVEISTIRNAYVTDTDWTTETILLQLERGNIQLNPTFQRRDAWPVSKKTNFIESLILNLPIPQIVLAELPNTRGKYIVLDGKQRLLSIRQFAAGEDDEFETLKLSPAGLDVFKIYKSYSLEDLKNSAPDSYDEFTNKTIRTVVVRNWPNEEFLNMVFLRLNTGSVQLAPQELRQALHPGSFVSFIDNRSAASTAIQRALRIKSPDSRMRDAEILLRYIGIKMRYASYRGNLKKFLDDTCKHFNENWDAHKNKIEDLSNQFDLAVDFILDKISEDIFSKYNFSKNSFEKRFNRAIFEALIFHLSSNEVRDSIAQTDLYAEKFIKNYQSLFLDQDFVDSVEKTTKTQEAIETRINKIGDFLKNTFNSPIENFSTRF